MGKKGWKNKRIWCVVIAAAVSQKVKDSKKFQIIEVVPDASEGEIGYLVKNKDTDITGDYLKKNT